jgi:hypothetical protein
MQSDRTQNNVKDLFQDFLETYDPKIKDDIWANYSKIFKEFWYNRILDTSSKDLADEEIDKIIRILDRHAKGNTKNNEAVAKAMIAQGVWRRFFNDFRKDKELAGILTQIFEETVCEKRADYIDQLYKINATRKNGLTGPSGNAINIFLVAIDPFNNSSAVSLSDRKKMLDYFNFPYQFDFDKDTIGKKIVESNLALLEGFRSMGVVGSARTISCFCYYQPIKTLWRGEHSIKREDKEVVVSVPTESDTDEEVSTKPDEVRESIQIQALLAEIGERMGMKIWLPKADRNGVLKKWKPEEGSLLDRLPLNYDDTTLKTIEQIDVLWLRKRSIVRAFEVEHTTSVYSGILRMADLIALQPNMAITLHIVAPSDKRAKVFQEIRRPVFSLLEGRPLAEVCTYLSYDSLREISKEKHIEHLSDKVLEKYAEEAE